MVVLRTYVFLTFVTKLIILDISDTKMAIGELRALPIGRGQIGKVKYIPVGMQGRGGRGIPSSVIKTGVKLPQLEDMKQIERVNLFF